MGNLSTELRNKLERTCIAARNEAERGAKAALEAVAVQHHEAYGHMSREQKDLRNKLRAHARQLGDVQDAKGQLSIEHLARECGYEHWHRMLFARFLAENNLLMEPEMGVAISLDECKELAKDAKTNLWALAGRYAQTMLPEVFRADDPVLQVPLAREDQLKLEELLDGLSSEVFAASDSLGWCYQFWQTERKATIDKSEIPRGADEIPAVTQLFTEDYMVDFLLDNALGGWWAAKVLAANPKLAEKAESEDELRKAVALADVPWKYLRFIKGKNDRWIPATSISDGWPKAAKELKCLDPCMGSGHFVVAMFERLVAMRMVEEKLCEKAAIAAVINDNLFGLELDPRCTQIGAFNLALAAWRRVGHCALPAMNLACSGRVPNSQEADWLAMAGDNQKLQRGMERVYRLFQEASVLGSLINPSAGEGDLLVAAFHEVQPLLEKALAQETKDDTAHELAVTARGLAKAAEILACHFTLVATNVPYLGRAKQNEVLQDYCERVHPDAKADLATCFVERCVAFCGANGSAVLVTPQTWTFLGAYADCRRQLLLKKRWTLVAKLGPAAFQDMNWWAATTLLVGINQACPDIQSDYLALDASATRDPLLKGTLLLEGPAKKVLQKAQLSNPDCRILLEELEASELLDIYAEGLQGISSTDLTRFIQYFWERCEIRKPWVELQSSFPETAVGAGREQILNLGELELVGDEQGAAIRGRKAWGKASVIIRHMRHLPATLGTGEPFDANVACILPKKPEYLLPIWAFCSSDTYNKLLRKIDQKTQITNATLVKVPFELAHWQKVALEKYPHGLPKPFSSDPKQWLFNGQPKGSDQPLHVAVARLLGYQWPRQTGSNFPDCRALGPDGLEKLTDDKGIVCLPSVRGEAPAAERLRKLLSVALGKDWESTTELELTRATGSNAVELEEWLRDDFFEQHCDLFYHCPFLWHIWDGRRRDGFHALVNYHKLANGDQGRRALESLTHSYLGDWITRQKDGLKRGEEGADERLAAALALKEKLEAILAGEPPFDIFVRWKPLSQQAIGWQPDINDGVRMNIRPFMASNLPNGKAGAGILRWKPKIKWDKDRGKEPHREKSEFPWFWSGGEFTGDRVNDVHLTTAEKERARKSK